MFHSLVCPENKLIAASRYLPTLIITNLQTLGGTTMSKLAAGIRLWLAHSELVRTR